MPDGYRRERGQLCPAAGIELERDPKHHAVLGQIGCRVWEVSLTRPEPAAPLKDRAQSLATRASGLLEALRLLEIDEEGRTALLRSDRPTVRDGKLGYYEVLRQGNGASSVRRYQAAANAGRREQVGFNLTHETLGKLVSDLAAC